ncbi:uncharacterized protein LOC105789527 [Gossypium raimondii]|uniref:uncharacterized protein LOC105789527 n=1 Tax=Gossypium raimondii TaxID=29730 RepID=UPI00063A8D68|nr:uncharacterized protein LOC105789527 [Gossypium raimondii]
MAPYKALYGCKCRTPLFWTELVYETEDKVRLIQDRLKAAFDRQKSYADLKRHKIEFIGLYRILKRVGPVAYQLELPLALDCIHDVFHVSMLRRYHSNPTHIVSVKEIEVRPDSTFEEEPAQILDRDVKVLRRKTIHLVKVLWRNHSTEEAMWEPEDAMHQ